MFPSGAVDGQRKVEGSPLSAGQIALLAGLFLAPLLLLWAGHHLRRKSRRVRGAFWGGLAGHTIASLIAIWYSMVPPEAWLAGDTVRGVGGFYGMLVGGALGAAIGLLKSQNHKSAS